MVTLTLSKRDINRIKCVDLLVSRYYQTSLYQFIKQYNYDIIFQEIVKQLTDNYDYNLYGSFCVEIEDSLEVRYYEIESKFSYGSDLRGVAERIISLGVNWVVEDVIVHKSSSVFILVGCDNQRDFLVTPITNMLDLKYVGSGESFYVEVCSDFTSFMKREHRYDLRKLKYNKIEDLILSEKRKVLLLFVDVVDKSFYCAWFSQRSYNCFDKYSKNTVSFEFDDSVVFRDFIDLFKLCQKYQLDKSLYSNFEVAKEKKKVKKSSYEDEYEDEGFWESLFNSEPAFIKNMRDVDMDMTTYEEVLTDSYLHDDYNEFEYYNEKPVDEHSNEPNLGSEFTELPNDFPIPFDIGEPPPEKERVEIDFSELSYPYEDESPF